MASPSPTNVPAPALPADRGEFDIAPWLPPLLALIASVSTGLTSFGDAVVFHVLWAICGAAGLLPAGRRETLPKAVLYLSILPLTNLPPMLWTARRDLKRCLPWACLEASSSILTTPVGALLLLGADLSALKIAVGLFFLVFSTGQLLAAARHYGLFRAQRGSKKEESDTLPRGEDGAAAEEHQADGPTTHLDESGSMPARRKTASAPSSPVVTAAAPALSNIHGRNASSVSLALEMGRGGAQSPISSDAVVVPSYADASALTSGNTSGGSSGAAASPSPPAAASPWAFAGASFAPADRETCGDGGGDFDAATASAGGGSLAKSAPSRSTVLVSTPSRDPAAGGGEGIRRSDSDTQILAVPPPLSQFQWLYTLVPISARASVRVSALLLWSTGLLSGLLGGMIGTSGPPFMVAYAFLGLDKDTIRGVTTLNSLLTIGLRLALYATAAGNVYDPHEMGVYLAIACAGWSGVGIGTLLRRHCDSQAILRVLFVLVYATSGILLGALDSGVVAGLFGAGTLLLAGAMGGCMWHPLRSLQWPAPGWTGELLLRGRWHGGAAHSVSAACRVAAGVSGMGAGVGEDEAAVGVQSQWVPSHTGGDAPDDISWSAEAAVAAATTTSAAGAAGSSVGGGSAGAPPPLLPPQYAPSDG